MSVIDRVAPQAVDASDDRERSAASAAAPSLLSPSPMLMELLSGMRDARIRYCHCKSASRIERAMAGEGSNG
jgi:hypothetical protein